MAVTACTSADNRKESAANPIARRKVDITIPDEDTVGTVTFGVNGRIIGLTYDVPALDDGANTVTFVLSNEDGTALYTKATIPDAAYTQDRSMVGAASPNGIAFAGDLTITATASAAQTEGDTLISVILYIL